MEEVKLYPGSIDKEDSQVYTSISGFQLLSNGATQNYTYNSYYSLSRMCDGSITNAYIVKSSYTNVVITVTLPRVMFIHHIRLYPVCKTRFNPCLCLLLDYF